MESILNSKFKKKYGIWDVIWCYLPNIHLIQMEHVCKDWNVSILNNLKLWQKRMKHNLLPYEKKQLIEKKKYDNKNENCSIKNHCQLLREILYLHTLTTEIYVNNNNDNKIQSALKWYIKKLSFYEYLQKQAQNILDEHFGNVLYDQVDNNWNDSNMLLCCLIRVTCFILTLDETLQANCPKIILHPEWIKIIDVQNSQREYTCFFNSLTFKIYCNHNENTNNDDATIIWNNNMKMEILFQKIIQEKMYIFKIERILDRFKKEISSKICIKIDPLLLQEQPKKVYDSVFDYWFKNVENNQNINFFVKKIDENDRQLVFLHRSKLNNLSIDKLINDKEIYIPIEYIV